jgi:hypothetical protein
MLYIYYSIFPHFFSLFNLFYCIQFMTSVVSLKLPKTHCYPKKGAMLRESERLERGRERERERVREEKENVIERQ